MRAVKSFDTAPEMLVRRLIFSMGYRYRLHRTDLPGKPDIVFSRLRKVIFVHGCFWHGHDCKRGERQPKTNAVYWANKIRRNKERDAVVQESLRTMGWDTLVIWECQTKDLDVLKTQLKAFL